MDAQSDEESSGVDEREFDFELSEQSLASEISERVRSLIAAAEAAAGAVRHEAEEEAQLRRRTAEQEAKHYLEDARRQADAHLQARLQRIADLSDAIMERGEAVLARLDSASEVRAQLEAAVRAMGESAEKLEEDARRAAPPDEPAPGEEIAPNAVETPEPPREPEEVPTEPEPEPEPEEAPAEPAPRPAAEEEEETLDGDVHVLDAAVAREVPPAPDEAPTAEEAGAARRDPGEQLLAARLVALQMAVAGGNRGEVEAHLRRAFEVENPQPILDDVFGRGTDAGKRVVWPEAG